VVIESCLWTRNEGLAASIDRFQNVKIEQDVKM